MKFECDKNKSVSNLKKHGINFEEAQLLWEDSNLLEIPAKTTDEPRFVVIGKINDKYWTGIITYRNDSIRIISVRYSRSNEVELYES